MIAPNEELSDPLLSSDSAEHRFQEPPPPAYEDTTLPASSPEQAGSFPSRLLDRNADFHQSRGHWGVRRLSQAGTRLRRTSQVTRATRGVKGILRSLWGDWFHALAYRPTLQLMAIIFFSYAFVVFMFAYVYLGVSTLGAKITVNPDGSTRDSFCGMDINNHMEALYFSLSTMTTIGYGVSDYYFGDCWTPLLLVLFQSCCAITFQSIAIGLLFQRISRGQKRSKTIIFSDKAVVRKVKGVPHFMCRIGELRRQHLIEVTVRCYCLKHERYLRNPGQVETAHFLTRHLKLHYPDESLGSHLLMSLPQVIVHRMDATSPLVPKAGVWYDKNGRAHNGVSTDEMMAEYMSDREVEIIVLVEGTDELTGQALQARHSYRWNDLAWGYTFGPCVQPWASEEGQEPHWLEDRRCERRENPICSVDFGCFHDIVPAEDTEECPFVPF
eukprot:CAMPEP_0119023742 /NCGR_PEP_ID=MMETSP1176-20130426/30560_1 /TAXON_ID=265551 /ORGANISM="Synedropsis recta cf, Strain CCMP1620" /LENGTH=440 /DNA_ID=CAMNT_0006978865 /DNA_START=87 /DNA_END=1409 /DNA_ORIENTATION=+